MTKCHKTTLVDTGKTPTYLLTYSSCYTSWLNPTPCTGSRASWQTEPSRSLAVGQATSKFSAWPFTIFIIYINDLNKHIKVTVRLFASGTAFYKSFYR